MPLDPVTASIEFGTSAVQSYGNYKTAKAIAEANIQMQRETNAQNYKMFQEQNEFNRQMVAEQNAYNLPSEQVARYRAAGLNPYLMMSGGASSVQSSPAQSGNPNPMVAPKIDPNSYTASWQMLGQGIHNAVSQMYQNEAIKQDVQGKKIDNMTKLQRNLNEIREISSRTNLNWAQKRILGIQEEILTGQMAALQEQPSFQNALTQMQTKETKQKIENLQSEKAMVDLQRVLTFHMSKAQISKLQAERNEIIERTANHIQERKESEARISVLVEQAANTYYDTIKKGLEARGQAISNEKEKDLYKVVKDDMIASLKIKLKEGMFNFEDFYNFAFPNKWRFDEGRNGLFYDPDKRNFDDLLKGFEGY